jgi:hypothetical protein
MNQRHLLVTGTVTGPLTITLDEALPADTARVRLWVEVLPPPGTRKPTMAEAIADIRARQKARGHIPLTTAQIDALLADPPPGEE